MNCSSWRCRLFPCGVRFASTHWRHVESNPPIVLEKFKNAAKPNVPILDILVKDAGKDVSKKGFTESKVEDILSSKGVVTFDKPLNEMLEESFDETTYKRMWAVQSNGFIQHREHFEELTCDEDKRYLITGSPGCGKTMTAFSYLLQQIHCQNDSLVVPALHLSRWFQDTQSTETIQTAKGGIDFPLLNSSFLEFFVKYNDYIENPDRNLLRDTVLLDDERWTAGLYSFKGESILNAARVGISTPSIASHVINVILNTLLEQNVKSQVIVDNANLLCEIHSSMLETTRIPEIKEWWDQPHLLPNNIPLLRSLRDFLTQHTNGSVLLTIDPRNEISERVARETGSISPHSIHIPNTPSEAEYRAYLNFLSYRKFISRTLECEEIKEFAYLTGRSYADTYKYMWLI